MDSKKRAESVSNEVLNVIKERRSIRTYKADEMCIRDRVIPVWYCFAVR